MGTAIVHQVRGTRRAAFASHGGSQKTLFITSPSNDYVKRCTKLRTSGRFREQEGSVLVVGQTPISELSHEVPNLNLKTLLWAGKEEDMPAGWGASMTMRVNEMVMRKVAGLQSATGILAAAEIGLPEHADFAGMNVGQLDRLLVLDGVQDPGNLGTLLRTATALGWQGAFLLPGCCDPFNDKALRASRGAAFKLPFAVGEWQDLQAVLSHHHLTCLAAMPQETGTGEVPATEKEFRPESWHERLGNARVALVLGSEGRGVSEAVRKNSVGVAVPMVPGSMESLCVSQAGAILLSVFSSNFASLLATVNGLRLP